MGDITKLNETAAFANDVEEIAMLGRGRVGLMCS